MSANATNEKAKRKFRLIYSADSGRKSMAFRRAFVLTGLFAIATCAERQSVWTKSKARKPA